jgi:hypothetical protein
VGPGTVTDSGHGPRSPGSVTDRAVAGHLVLRCTGLPSRSAPVAPPLRLAALRWREVIFIFVRIQPPPSVSTACLVAVTHVPGRPFPGEPHTVLCPSKLERNRHNTVYCTPAGARILVLRRGRDSRTTGSHEVANRRRGAPGAHGSGAWHPPVALRSKAGPFSFGGAWLRHARCGEPAAASGSAAAAATEAGAGTAPGPGAATVSGHGPPVTGVGPRTEPHRKTRSCGSVWDRSSDSGSPEARCGHGDRSSVTGSVTDQGVAENQRQGQRQGQEQLQQQQTAPGTGTVTDTGHGPRSPGSVTDRAVAGHLVLRCTGLPSRSALVAPPFRLAALRWREVIFIFVRIQPPPSVSTACLVAVTHVPGRPFPGEPHTVLCPSKLERNRHNTVYCTPAGARILVLRRGRDSRTTGSHEVANRRRGAPGAHGSGAWHPPVALRSKAGPFSFGGAWLRHARCGEPAAASGSAAAAAAGAAAGTAPGPGAATVSGHGPRSPGSVTDRAAPEDQELRQLDPGQTHSRTHGSVRAVNPRMR